MFRQRDIENQIRVTATHAGNDEHALEIAQTNAKAANSFADAQDSKVKRTAVKWGIRSVGAVTLSGMSMIGCNSMIDKFADSFDSGITQETAQITPEMAVGKITIPNESILVRAEGTGSVHIPKRPKSDFPVFGAVYNETLAKWQDTAITVARTGDVNLVARRNALTLEPYTLPGNSSSTTKATGIRATVDIGMLSIETAKMRTARNENGDVKVDTDDDILAIESADDVAKRAARAGDVADVKFEEKCGTLMKKVLKAGVMLNATDLANNAAGLLVGKPGSPEQQISNMLKTMAKQPVDVKFVEKITINGRTQARPASSELPFPDRTEYNHEELAKSLGVKPKNLKPISSGSCKLTDQALQQYYDLLSKSNGVDPRKVGY